MPVDAPRRRWVGFALVVAGVLLAAGAIVLATLDSDGGGSKGRGLIESSDGSDHALVWAVGDGADGHPPAEALARTIDRSGPDRFLYLGDVYETGTPAEFERNYDAVYGDLADVTAPTPGNHDWPNHTEGYDVYWQPGGDPPPDHYAFELGGWQVISLNSEADGPGRAAEARWLDHETSGGGTCRIAFWHRPRFSAGFVHGDTGRVAAFWNTLRGRAAIVLNGHDHDYQRFNERDGIVEFVVGSGGHEHYSVHTGDPRLAFADDEDYGALRLELQPGSARYEFTTADGDVLDDGTVRCERLES